MSLLNQAAQGIRANIGIALVVRACTFVLNIFVARFTDVESYGRANVSFYLFQALGLFATKEIFRRVAVRKTEGQRTEGFEQSAVRLANWSVATALMTNLLLLTIWICYPPSLHEGSQKLFYPYAAVLLCIANVLEASAEPYVVVETLDMHLTTRARAEGAGFLIRSVLFFLMVFSGLDFLFSFAVAQCSFSVVWFMWFRRAARYVKSSDALSTDHVQLFKQFLFSGLQKLMMTEAEKFFLMAWFDQTAWGIFSLVTNLGSLILRLIFAPLEDVAFSTFSRASKEECTSLMQTLFGIQGILGLLAAMFAPFYAHVVITILYGPKWIDAIPTLQVYGAFLFFSALNGVLEAYCFSTATKRWLTINQVTQVFVSVCMFYVAYNFRHMGSVSLIFANTMSLALRGANCLTWVKESIGLRAMVHAVIPKMIVSSISIGVVSALVLQLVVYGTKTGREPDLNIPQGRHSHILALIPEVCVGAASVLLLAFVLRREARLLVSSLVDAKKTN